MTHSSQFTVKTAVLRPAPHNARLAAGMTVSGPVGRLEAALVAAGAGSAASIETIACATAMAPDDVVGLLRHLVNDTEPHASARLVASLARRLAEIESQVLQKLLTSAEVSPTRVSVAVIHDPGIWPLADDRPAGYASLCDSALLAEMTGLNIVDALPARDIAAGGLGGPVTALAEARLLGARQRNTLLVDVGRTVRATYVPACGLNRGSGEPYRSVLSFHVGPGTRLLDALVEKLTGGSQSIDVGGRLAVQGQQIPELLAHWQRDNYFDRPLPRWQTGGVRPERFLMESYQLAVRHNWSVRDLLCTATHFIAQTVAETIRRLPVGCRVDEIVLTGGGTHNGFLMRQLASRVTGTPLVRVADRCCPAETFEAAAVATVGLLTVEHLPATTPEISGVREPCIAGRLTPGRPAAWRRLVTEMSAATGKIPLRYAS